MSTSFDVGRRHRPRDPVETVEQAVSAVTWMVGPVAPRPYLRNRPHILVSGRAGDRTDVALKVINRQRSPVSSRIAIGSLTSSAGRVWRPSVSAFVFLEPETATVVKLRLEIPPRLDPGTYEGILLLVAVDSARVPMDVEVT